MRRWLSRQLPSLWLLGLMGGTFGGAIVSDRGWRWTGMGIACATLIIFIGLSGWFAYRQNAGRTSTTYGVTPEETERWIRDSLALVEQRLRAGQSFTLRFTSSKAAFPDFVNLVAPHLIDK